MADNPPNVPGGVPPAPVPPKPAEAAKVQPKKETVRISLPPKPTASPTIKLPTLPAGGGPIGSAAPPPPAVPTSTNLSVAVPPSTGGATPAPPRPPTSPGTTQATISRPATSTGGPRPAAPAAAAASAPRPAAAVPKRPSSLSGLDVGLAIAAGVVALGAVVSVLLLLQIK
jgi:hypothetical protein